MPFAASDHGLGTSPDTTILTPGALRAVATSTNSSVLMPRSVPRAYGAHFSWLLALVFPYSLMTRRLRCEPSGASASKSQIADSLHTTSLSDRH
jgi:hypothetical protein